MKQRNVSGQRQGFTIVELAVVIVVLGILLALAGFGYSNWRRSSAETTLSSDLSAVAAAMEQEKNFSSGYPSSVPSSVQLSNQVSVSVMTSGDRRSFCAQASTSDYAGLTYRYRKGAVNPDAKPVQGTCV